MRSVRLTLSFAAVYCRYLWSSVPWKMEKRLRPWGFIIKSSLGKMLVRLDEIFKFLLPDVTIRLRARWSD